MSLIYITGVSGSGKSAVLHELEKRGYEAYGIDEEGYADWVDRQTGAITPFPRNPEPDIHDSYRTHRWVMSEQRIGELKQHAGRAGKPVFLIGVAEEDGKVWHLFGKVLVLSIDEATMRSRIENRTDNQFGKHPEEMAAILKWLNGYEDTYRGFGAVIVDATRPLTQVVDDVIAQSA